jgi:hypothetical protein
MAKPRHLQRLARIFDRVFRPGNQKLPQEEVFVVQPSNATQNEVFPFQQLC